MKNYFILLFLFTVLYSSSQEETKEYDYNPKLAIFITPLSLIDVYDGPSIRYGVDVKIYKDFSTTFEGGNYIFPTEIVKINASGYLFKSEIKYRILENGYSTQYIGIEHQYKQQSYDFKDSISLIPEPVFEKKYSIKRKVNCFSLKYSFAQELAGKFSFTYYFGLGVRFIQSSNNLTIEENKGILSSELHGGTQIKDVIRRPIGNSTTINLLAGIKLGYTLF